MLFIWDLLLFLLVWNVTFVIANYFSELLTSSGHIPPPFFCQNNSIISSPDFNFCMPLKRRWGWFSFKKTLELHLEVLFISNHYNIKRVKTSKWFKGISWINSWFDWRSGNWAYYCARLLHSLEEGRIFGSHMLYESYPASVYHCKTKLELRQTRSYERLENEMANKKNHRFTMVFITHDFKVQLLILRS